MKRSTLRRQHIEFDKNFLILTLILTVLGIVFLADASAPLALRNFSDKFYYAKQQLMWAFIGILILIFCLKVNYKFWEKIATPMFFLNVILLLLVFVPGLGPKVLGARRWLYLGHFNFQPSELLKLSLTIYIAKLASKGKGYLSYMLPILLSGILIMLEPDLGTTIIIMLIGFTQLFVSGVNIFLFIGTLLGGGIIGALLTWLSGYRRDRLLTFLKATQDPLGKEYHIRQILISLGSGGLFGVGLGQSRQKYLFLPETATDSIFAVIAEEIGFFGSLAIIVVFCLYILRGIRIARNAPDSFARILSIGIVTWIGGQIFLNLGSMVALIPLTGIPLPFFSSGGSSLVTILAASGILLNISSQSTIKLKR